MDAFAFVSTICGGSAIMVEGIRSLVTN